MNYVKQQTGWLNKEMNGKILVVSQGLPCCLTYFSSPFSTVSPKLVRNEVSLSTEVAPPPTPSSPVSCCRQRGSPCCTELPEAKTLSGGDLPLSHHRSQQWNHCWGSHLQHTKDKGQHVPAASRWIQERPLAPVGYRGGTTIVRHFLELFSPCASSTSKRDRPVSLQSSHTRACLLSLHSPQY